MKGLKWIVCRGRCSCVSCADELRRRTCFWGTRWESLGISHALLPFPGRLNGKPVNLAVIWNHLNLCLKCNTMQYRFACSCMICKTLYLSSSLCFDSKIAQKQPERKAVAGQHFSIGRYHLENGPANSALWNCACHPVFLKTTMFSRPQVLHAKIRSTPWGESSSASPEVTAAAEHDF